MCEKKYIIHLYSGLITEDLFLKHEGEKGWNVQTFTLAP